MDPDSSVRIESKDPENRDGQPAAADVLTPGAESYDEAGPESGLRADDLIRRAANLDPDGLAFADPPNRDAFGMGPARSMTYGRVDALVSAIAAKLADYGLEPGSVVATQLPNIHETPVLIAAAWRAGLAVVPMPMMWRLNEIHQAIAQLDPAAIITIGQFAGHDHADTVCEAAAHHISIRHVFGLLGEPGDGISPIDGWFAEDASGAAVEDTASAGSPDTTAIMTWADSPAGPYPVPRTHAELVAAGKMFVDELGLAGGDIMLNAYPFTSIVSAGGSLVAALLARAPLILHQPFDYKTFIAQLQSHAVTWTAVPPAVIAALHEQGDLAGAGASLSRIGCIRPAPHAAGAPAGLPDLETDMPIFDICNLSELAVMVRPSPEEKTSAELPLGKLRAGSAQPEDGAYLETRVRGSVTTGANGGGERHLNGTLYVRGPVVPSGPFGKAGALARTLLKPDSQGYLDTGISCTVDESRAGMFRCERNPELVHHGGVAVSVAELDRVYSDFPGFLDAAAFTIDDRIMGERIFAAVIPRPDAVPSLSDLKRFLAEKGVAPYKIPDQLVTVASIPRASDGRILRNQILGQI